MKVSCQAFVDDMLYDTFFCDCYRHTSRIYIYISLLSDYCPSDGLIIGSMGSPEQFRLAVSFLFFVVVAVVSLVSICLSDCRDDCDNDSNRRIGRTHHEWSCSLNQRLSSHFRYICQGIQCK